MRLEYPWLNLKATKMGLLKRSIYKSNASLEGKTVLITGANTGIGYETAKGLLQKGKNAEILK
jgi:FlaA1/EpsC-like NDP-sugar epimerase